MTLRLIRYILYIMITSGYINYARADPSHSQKPINKRPLMRCNSAPDLNALYNTTYYMSASAASGVSDAKPANAASVSNVPSVSGVAALGNKENNIIPSNKYKSIIFNRYKRNIYLRSKEKYTLGEK
uniref:Uncharacterized protein n=1 Tax=viral metagenome TaxID=1070528 RepID=A0A6C0K6C7_9ZZZZ